MIINNSFYLYSVIVYCEINKKKNNVANRISMKFLIITSLLHTHSILSLCVSIFYYTTNRKRHIIRKSQDLNLKD